MHLLVSNLDNTAWGELWILTLWIKWIHRSSRKSSRQSFRRIERSKRATREICLMHSFQELEPISLFEDNGVAQLHDV